MESKKEGNLHFQIELRNRIGMEKKANGTGCSITVSGRSTAAFFILSFLLVTSATCMAKSLPTIEAWEHIITQSAFHKSGMDRLNNPKFQYPVIGLGGTTMRVDPWGFASHRAPHTDQNSHNHKPSFGYEYWWDKTGHRYNPFLIKAGYGASFDPGTITAFEQTLDIRTGVLQTDLTLIVEGATFTSSREAFITPDGILVIRVKDKGAPLPLQLNLAINETVEWFGPYYDGEEDPFKRDAAHSSNRSVGAVGGVVAVSRPNTSDCAVAVAVEATSTETVSANSDIYSQTAANGTITFYIAPESSFNPATPTVPWDHAWNAASSAKKTGYTALKQQTADWWRDFLHVSKISVPDEAVLKLYVQSLYYHGIYFGNTAIPPGCFGTDIYGFFGAVCPEYDLVFSSFAMAYTGHTPEVKNMADWVYSVLPKCKEQATKGVRHHDVFRQYEKGAIYTTLMGYDGALTIQPELFEGRNLTQNYPGLNAARMALNYLDFSDDQTFKEAAHDVLKSTTYIALKDLVLDANGQGYIDGKIPNAMQQGAVLMGYDQCVKRGIAEPEWISKYDGKILIPVGQLNGETLLSAHIGHNPAIGEGSATYFYPLWWATVIDKHDHRAIKAIDNYHENFQSYCFNNGWSGVHSAKLYRGDDALMWLENFQRPDVLLDETSFAENSGPDGYNYTPEIGAHGAYVCNLTQMMIDPDDDTVIDIFPAIPSQWEFEKIAFEGLMTTGALSFTAERDMDGVKVEVTNKANSIRERKLRIKIPMALDYEQADGLTMENEFIVNTVRLSPGQTKTLEYTFTSNRKKDPLRDPSTTKTMPQDKTVVADKFTPAEIGCVKLTGLLGKHVDSVPKRLMNGQREAYLGVFENPVDTKGWQAEHIGKWLETACNAIQYNKDPNLRATVDDVVDRLIKLQEFDGWLGSYAPEYRFQNYDWKKNAEKKYEPFWDGPFYDVWCHYLTMGGLIRDYEVTGNPRGLHAAQKIADLLIETFGEGKQDIMLINHDHGFGPGVGVFQFSKLYLLTGEVRYRDFAKYVTSQYGRVGKVPIIMTEVVDGRYPFPDWAQIKHCELELCLAGLCQLYRSTGDQDMFATCQNIYDGYFAPLNETMCFHGFKTPPPGMHVPDTYYGFLETCDIVPMLRWFMEMARITGDSQYLDALEWNLYNALLSRDLPDGRVWPGHQPPTDDLFHCCTSMLSVGLSYIPSWVYCTTPDGIMVNLYESSVFSAQVAGVKTTIEQTTQYPLDGTVNLTIKPETSSSFELLLRIPSWCKEAQVFVNGKALDADPQPGTFLKINRQWGTSDSVKLVLDMPARTIPREFGGKDPRSVVTLQRGPLLLALTARQNPDVSLDKISPQVEPDGTMNLAASFPLDPVNSSSVTFRGRGVDSGNSTQKTIPVTFVPYAYSGVSDKPMPAPKEGVFNVYSEDSVGPDVRVEFPLEMHAVPFSTNIEAEESARFVIDAEQNGDEISPLLFGHNLEVTRRAVWSGIGAEMVANRKFAAVNNGMPKQWTVTDGGTNAIADENVAYVGKNSLRVEIGEYGSGGIRQQQESLAFSESVRYAFRCWLKSQNAQSVWMRIMNGQGTTTLCQVSKSITSEDWQLWSGEFVASATAENARLEIGSDMAGVFWVGVISVQRADNFHGMRRDVIALLKQIKPGTLRFPGGCYSTFYRWRDGLLPVDRRPPIGPIVGAPFLLPNTDDYDNHEIGIDEFMALCREVACEAAITIPLSGQLPADGASWVEYCNGSPQTKWGKIRAERGHNEPYRVGTWFLGNEVWWFGREGSNKIEKAAPQTKSFATAIRLVDPSVRLVACTILTYDHKGWNTPLLEQAGSLIDYISGHDYRMLPEGSPLEAIEGAPLEFYATQATSHLGPVFQKFHKDLGKPIVFDEWNTMWGRKGSVAMGLHTAGVLNLLCREAQTLGVEQAYFFQPITEGAISVSPLGSSLDTAGQVFDLFKVHQGNRRLNTSPALSHSDVLDLCASLTSDGECIYVTVINRNTSNEVMLELSVRNFSEPTDVPAKLLVPLKLDAESESTFVEQELKLQVVDGKVLLKMPPCGIACISFGVCHDLKNAAFTAKSLTSLPSDNTAKKPAQVINRDPSQTYIRKLHKSWKDSLDAAVLIKSNLSAPNYQYPIIGNGGLNLLADPLGFTAMKPENAPYAASLEYCYWWNNNTARLRPFSIQALYDTLDLTSEGEIESFTQKLEMGTGILTSSLNLKVGNARFASKRTAFVTRDGVLVIRMSDSDEHNLRIKVSGLPGYALTYSAMPNGLCAMSNNADHNQPVLAVMAIGADVVGDKEGFISVSLAPGKDVILFVAASSGLENSNPVEAAFNKTQTALEGGYAATQSANNLFWKDFWSRSSVSLPDKNLQKWYIRSQYYHGAMMSNTPIPVGCFGPRHEGFLGGPCPEYDLSFDFLAMLRANQTQITAPVADWIEKTLPEARKLAAVYIPGSTGARYPWVSSWNGKESRFCGNTSSPVDNGWEAFPSACCAMMVLKQAQYTNDAGRLETAKTILELTTQHQLDNAEQDQDLQGFWVSKKFLWTWNAPWFFVRGAIHDQAALLWSLRTARTLGVGPKQWAAWADEVFLPTGYDNSRGQEVIVGFKDATTANIVMPMLYPFYFLTTIAGDDPLVQPTYMNVTQSKDVDYIFNRGWAACVAARGGYGDEALVKLHRLTEEKDALFDDTYLSEVKNMPANTPEIGAHAMVMQGIQEMLMNDASPSTIKVFPALPMRWEESGVNFQNLLANGAITVSASYTENLTTVKLENLTDRPVDRILLVRIPSTYTEISEASGIPIEEIYKGRFAKLTVTVPAQGSRSVALRSKSDASWVTIDDTNPVVQYTSNWKVSTSDAECYNSTVHYSTTAGSGIKVMFNGDSVRVIGERNADHGQMKVVLDGILQGYYDTWSPTPVKQAVLFEKHGLAPQKHAIELICSDIKSAYSTGTRISLDLVQYFDTNQMQTVVDNTSFTYEGEWTFIKDQSDFIGESAKFSEVAGSSTEVAFSGERIRLIGSRGNNHGLATIVLDGKMLTTIDLYSFSEIAQQVLWESPPLPQGNHVLKILVTGSNNVNSRGPRVTLDAAQIIRKLNFVNRR